MIQKELDLNTQEPPISQDIQNCDRIKSIKRNLKITRLQELDKIQEYHKENQMCIFQCQNPRNCGKKRRPLGAHKLGQEVQITSY